VCNFYARYCTYICLFIGYFPLPKLTSRFILAVAASLDDSEPGVSTGPTMTSTPRTDRRKRERRSEPPVWFKQHQKDQLDLMSKLQRSIDRKNDLLEQLLAKF
jgi:hypothetical protein